MRNSRISPFKAAAAYIGTVVGAGFATGQEVLQFFLRFGKWGLPGIALSTLMFIAFGYIIMEIGMLLDANSHLKIIKYTSGSFFGKIVDYIITFFLFSGLTAMLAGTGALFAEQLNLPAAAGNLLMAVLTTLTVLKGLKRVIDSISYVVPFLIASVIGISLYSMFQSPPQLNAVPASAAGGLIPNWFLAAVLYTSYNTILSISVLGPLGNETGNKKTILCGAVLGGIGLGLGSVMIYLALSGSVYEIEQLEVPMVYIAGKISPLVQTIYAIVLIAEVYTTAVGSLYGFSARLADPELHPVRSRAVTISAAILAFCASFFGFSNMVKYLYPLVGYGGIILLAGLLYGKIKRVKAKGL